MVVKALRVGFVPCPFMKKGTKPNFIFFRTQTKLSYFYTTFFFMFFWVFKVYRLLLRLIIANRLIVETFILVNRNLCIANHVL